jgi:hypothetical protein
MSAERISRFTMHGTEGIQFFERNGWTGLSKIRRNPVAHKRMAGVLGA